jgi:ATP/maltotriose-dependent transcriptional regulator MalT
MDGALRIAERLIADREVGSHDQHYVLGQSPYLHGLTHAGFIHMFRGELTIARQYHERGSTLAHELGELEAAVWSTFWRAHLHALQGDARACESLAARMYELARHFESGLVRVALLLSVSFTHLAAQRWRQALATLEECYAEGHAQCCARVMSPLVLANLADTYLRLGQLDKALQYAREIVTLCEEGGLVYSAQPWLVLARCQMAAACPADARANLQRALEIIERTGARVYLGELHELRATFAQKYHDTWDVAQELDRAHEHYAAIEADAHIARLQARGTGFPLA